MSQIDDPEDELAKAAYEQSEEILESFGSDELLKSARKLRMRRARMEIPQMSISSRIIGSSRETTPPSTKGNTPIKFRSVKLEAKPHSQPSKVAGKPYTKEQSSKDLKTAIKEEVTSKLEAAGNANTNPRLPRLLALKGKKLITVHTNGSTYSTPAKNVIIGIHGTRYDVAIQNPKMVFKH